MAEDTPAHPLADYHARRDFAATPEPAGDAPALPAAGDDEAGGRFVVHQHDATRLHFDLRLERGGVLVSWAIPRGLPPAPADNRLAVHTEDHPLEYLDFHGTIPAGSYGAGDMLILDHGTYDLLKWEDAKVEVLLHGDRYTGRYALFHTSGRDWMIHRMDPPTDPAWEPLPEAPPAPMLARAGEMPAELDRGRWAFEPKWDGMRVTARVSGGRVQLYSRTGRDVTASYPELHRMGRQLGPAEVLLDGEVVAFNDEGVPDFHRLQERMHVTDERQVRRRMKSTPVTYAIFDVTYLDGRDLTGEPWGERRRVLESLGLEGAHWRVPAARVGEGGEELLERAAEMGIEGVVCKRVDSRYEPGRRSGAWVKVRLAHRQEFVVAGWQEGAAGTRSLGSLLLAVWQEGELVHVGNVGTGFTEAERARLLLELDANARSSSPLAREQSGPGRWTSGRDARAVHYVQPVIVVDVAYAEVTPDGVLRHPTYRGERTDVDPATVMWEDQRPPEPLADQRPVPSSRGDEGQVVEVGGRRLKVSNLDKVLYPGAGFTKAAVIDYYARIAAAMLPHLTGRPLTMIRFPDGVGGESFFEKRAPRHHPDWVHTAAVAASRGGKVIEYVVVDDIATLVWCANLAALELHVPMGLASGPNHPTAAVFDLDPGEGADIVDCCDVALAIDEVLADHGVDAWPKTSGSKGLQLYVPLNTPDVTMEQSRAFAQHVAVEVERRLPGRVVTKQQKTLRHGKVLVDWYQNHAYKTTIAAYSLRARTHPTVSTPVTWEEVEACASSRAAADLVFTALDVLDRVAAHGDLFAPVLEVVQALPGD